MGWSLGGALALLAAAQSDAVIGVATIEPGVMYLLDHQEQAALGGAVAQLGELVAQDRLPEAARAFAGWPFTDDDLAVADDAGYFDAAGRYAPHLLSFIQQNDPNEGGPGVLGEISAPVSVLIGSNGKPFFATCARHVADHVPNGRVQAIPDAGHATPLTHPEVLAQVIADFFAPVHKPA